MKRAGETTFGELLRTVEWSDVELELCRFEDSENQIAGYRQVFEHLHELTPEPNPMRIVLERDPSLTDEERPIEVAGRNGQKNRESSDFHHFSDQVDEEWASSEIDWALSLTPWEEWLGMKIDPKTLEEFAPAVIVAHSLWDMTFHGFTQEKVREVKMELKREVDAIDAMTEEEREKYLIPLDEVLRELDDDSEIE